METLAESEARRERLRQDSLIDRCNEWNKINTPIYEERERNKMNYDVITDVELDEVLTSSHQKGQYQDYGKGFVKRAQAHFAENTESTKYGEFLNREGGRFEKAKANTIIQGVRTWLKSLDADVKEKIAIRQIKDHVLLTYVR